ncbi:transposase, Ptta/En/Spm [Tanacetum coccineum]
MQEDPYIDEETLDRARDEKFAQWFKEHIQSNGGNEHLKVLARGPMRYVESHKGYFVNGYKFHTLKHGDGRVTHNSGVCVKGSTYNEFESDYYGLLVEVLEVNYRDSNGRCVVVLFKCDWFEPIQGVRVNRKHNLVDIKYKSKGCQNDPFILASQAEQVYYAPYPSMTKDLKDWWAVVKATPRSIYEVTQSSSEVVDDNVDVEEFFQENEMPTCSNTTIDVNENTEIEEVGDLEEFIDRYDDSDDENELTLSDHSSDEDEVNLSDHSSDKDEVNLSDHSLNDCLLIIINWTHYAGIMARDNNSKGRGRGRGRGRSGNREDANYDNGRRSGGRGRGISGNIGIGGGSSNVSGFGNQEDANYDNGSRSRGRGRGISGNIAIGGSSSNVSGFGNQEDANYDNGRRSRGRGRGIRGNIAIGGSSSNVSGFGNQEDANYDNGSRSSELYLSVFSKLCFMVLGQRGERLTNKAETTCLRNFRDAAHRATMDNITVGNDLSVLKPYTPSWIDQAHWDNMIDRLWNTSRWKKKSNVARQNRLTEVDGEVSKHTAGSKTILQHKFQMEKEKKRHVSLLEAYHRTHTSTNVSSEASGSGMDEASEGRTREYVTASSKRVADAVEAAIVEKHGPDASEHPPNDFDLWTRR